MSFETKQVVARLEAVEQELMELRSSCQSIAVALINITRLVDMAVAKLDGENPVALEAPEASD